MIKNVFGVSTEHVGGEKPWQVEVLNMKKKVVKTLFFKTQKEMDLFIESVLK